MLRSTRRRGIGDRPRTSNSIATGILTRIFALAAGLAVAAPASAVPLEPGETVTPNNRSGGAGTALVGDEPPFSVSGITGYVRWGVTDDSLIPNGIDPSLTLRFSYVIGNDAGSTDEDSISRIELSDFSGVQIDVVYNGACFGSRNPTSATRSADGSIVTIDFATPISAGNTTRCIYLRTDGSGWEEGGQLILRTSDGASTSLPIAQPLPAPEPAGAPLAALAALGLVASTRRAGRA